MQKGIYKPYDVESGIYLENNPWYGKECVIYGRRCDRVCIAFFANGKRYTDFILADEIEVENVKK